MAYQDTFYIYEVPVTCTGTGSHSWITADFKIEIVANPENTAYITSVFTRIDSEGRMNWTGDATLRVACNGQSKSHVVKLAMYESGTTAWDGPAVFTFSNVIGRLTLDLDFDLDLTITTGTNGNPGPTHNSDGGNLQHFYYNNYIITIGDGGVAPLLNPPTVSSIVNTNPLNGNSGISANYNSIGISWTESGTVTERYYKVDNGDWISTSSASATITGLSEGTAYTITVKSSNSAGSNEISTIIRTRYIAPSIGLSLISKTIETANISWTSTKKLSNLQYKVGSGNWVTISNINSSSGNVAIDKLRPNTSYTIYFKGVSAPEYDSLSSDEVTISMSTLDIAQIISVGECIFGNSISFNIKKPSTNNAKLKIKVLEDKTEEFEFDVHDGVNVFTPTQDQLDKLYKCFSNTDSILLGFTISTIGNSTWTTDQISNELQLTGIAKTAHVGVNNTSRRAQAFIGIDGTPRRAVVWIGVDNKPRRCI